MPKGTLRKPNDYYERISGFLRSTGDTPFTSREVCSKTGLNTNIVSVFLYRNTKKKFLRRFDFADKSGLHLYKLIKLPPLELSKGEAANEVWKLLEKTNRQLSERGIWIGVNIGRQRRLSKGAVHNVVLRLERKGALIRRDRGYVLNREFEKRPVLCSVDSVEQVKVS